jgi:hypothetical protein
LWRAGVNQLLKGEFEAITQPPLLRILMEKRDIPSILKTVVTTHNILLAWRAVPFPAFQAIDPPLCSRWSSANDQLMAI